MLVYFVVLSDVSLKCLQQRAREFSAEGRFFIMSEEEEAFQQIERAIMGVPSPPEPGEGVSACIMPCVSMSYALRSVFVSLAGRQASKERPVVLLAKRQEERGS